MDRSKNTRLIQKMENRKEIGGYIEFEHYNGKMLHEDAIALNSGRSALAYLIMTKKIRKIALPYFMCSSVINLCSQYGVEIRYYHINEQFLPVEENLSGFQRDEWLYLTNFYGQLSDEDIRYFCMVYKTVIVDYAQAYFQMPLPSVDSLYTCRKFFGVTDGAFLYTDVRLNNDLPQDESFGRMAFLLGRFERTASEFYQEYVENNRIFSDMPVMKMSKLTENFLRAINYSQVKQIRTENYMYLQDRLRKINLLQVKFIEGAFAYPLLLRNGSKIKKKLMEKKIYIPTFWPNVIKDMAETTYEHYLAENVLPLPCDHRYNIEDMEYMYQLIIEQNDSV